jgi:hypothetical protein
MVDEGGIAFLCHEIVIYCKAGVQAPGTNKQKDGVFSLH